MFTNCSFDAAKNILDCYIGKDCMEKFCKGLREYAMRIVNYEKKEIIVLADEENKSYKKHNFCYICKKEFNTDDDGDDDDDDDDNKKYYKVRYHCHYTGKFRGAAHNVCNLRYKTPKKNYCSIS